jgi:superfamily II helicase
MGKTSNLRTKVCDCGTRYNYTKGEPRPIACKECLQKQIDNLVQYDEPPSWDEFQEFLKDRDTGLLPVQEQFAKNFFNFMGNEKIIMKPKGTGKTFVYTQVAEYLKTK